MCFHCRLHVPDAYGEDGFAGDFNLGGGARRRRLATTSEASRVRARDILSTRAEDVDMAFGTEEAPLDHEMI